MFFYNLQLFAGEKTEQATPKKIREAREKGQVSQSKDINSALVLLFAFLTLNFMFRYWAVDIFEFYNLIMSYANNIDFIFSINNVIILFKETIILILKMSIPILFISLLIGILCSYIQVGFLFTTEPLGFKLNRINPISGFKRLFSLKSIVELVKSLIKTLALIYITSSYLMKEYVNIVNVIDMDILETIKYLWKIVFNIVIRSSIILFILAILDFLYQKWEYQKELKMSKHEVKEEYKQTEGDPLIKSKIKEKQRQISMRRMMQDIPKADVIITNPTHFAIAIKYDTDQDEAPKVIAKGKDLIAQNIKRVASENNIPLFENKPLAQALYHNVEIGEYIPPDLYQAVAEVLAYVYSLKNN